MTARNFVWLSITGGAWSLASNWNDLTDGADPSAIVPGAQDNITVMGPTGAAVQTIAGPGQAAAALFTGNTLLSGSFAIGALTLGQASGGGLLQLAAGTALSAGTAAIVSGSLFATGAGTSLSVSGTVTLGSASGSAATFNATGGSHAAVASLFLASAADSIYVDPASILEVGTAATGAAGQLTIDASTTLAGQGDANAYGQVANSGTITAQSGTLTLGTLSGTGALQIAAGATLALNGACAAGQSVTFTGALATLALNAEFDAPAGTLTGFTTGDAIDIRGSQISAAAYTATGASTGTLALYYGTQVAATLTLAGAYANTDFLTSGDGNGGTLITAATSAGGGGTPSPGTSTPDQYTWIATGSGAWKTASNWTDVTRGQTPAAIAPGVHNLVIIAAAQDSFTVIGGPANAATLSLTGEVALSGTYAIGTLAIGQAAGSSFSDGTLNLLPGASIAAATASIAAGALSLSGSASVLTIAGALTLGGGAAGIGLPTTSVSAAAGARLQAASLTLGGGSGNSLVTDPTASIEIGTAGGAALGAVTIDAGTTLSGNGQVNPLGQVIDNGTIQATGGTLTLGSVSGTGSLTVAAGATLELLAPTADPITLAGSAAAGPAGLAFANALDAPTGTISGLVLGDVLHLEGSSLTAVQFAPNATGGTLTLAYGSTAVARLHLAGSFTNIRFLLSPDGVGGSLIVLTNATGGGGGGGQTGTDQLSWTTPVSGGWGRASSWTDLTLGAPATLPPGAQTPVLINGPTGTSVQDISGGGTCASLTATGNTLLSGTYTTSQLSLAAGAALSDGANSEIIAAQAALASATLLVSGPAAGAIIYGTLSLTGAALAGAQAGGSLQCDSLTLAGGNATADIHAIFEVGTLGTAQLGALTIDAGAQASGSGSLNLTGQVTNNGTILAQGGTLWIGATSGAGQLSIGTEATLALAATDTCPIAFTGGGATLLLDSPQFPSLVSLTGFVQGDAIVTANTPVDSATYQPTGANTGILTLSEAGQQVGQLTLSGNYANDQFTAQPDGQGAQINFTPAVLTGPPPGTVTPDKYVWIGGHGTAWSTAANWQDVTQSQNPAALAPGLNDTDSIAGGAGQALTIAGPANAAGLSLSGTVSLSGTYAIGALTVGPIGVLAIGTGSTVAAAAATVAGGAALAGGTLAVAGTLTLGTPGGPAGALAATAGAVTQAGAIILAAGSTLATDATSSIEIGAATGAAPGSITIDPGGLLAGEGTISAAGPIIDQGTITASGGTLLLGAVSGTGSLVVGIGAELDLQSTASVSLTADLAGAGTLVLGQAALAASPEIADFGVGDRIILAPGGATAAVYAQTAPNQGVLTILAGTQTLAQLTLLGSQTGLAFAVTGSPGGGTILTALPAQNGGIGGGFMTNPISASETITLSALELSLEAALPTTIITALASAFGTVTNNPVVFVGYSPDGQQIDPPSNIFANLEVVGPDATSGSSIFLSAGYSAMLLEGSENLTVSDNGANNALLISNTGNDTVFAGGEGDTLVGGAGGKTVFLTSLLPGTPGALAGHDVTIVGGGNDDIYTNNDSALISTASGYHSLIIAGSPQTGQTTNDITLNGSDTVVCSNIGVNSSNDNITVQAAATPAAGELVFGQLRGLLNFVGGNVPATVVGSGGQLLIQGGAADGSIIWGGSSGVDYTAGAGQAIIVAGSGQTQINQGAGAVTVFGGTGQGEFGGAPGSIFVIGGGQSTVQAAAGVGVYIFGGGNTSVAGSAGADAFAGTSTGNNIFQAGAGPETLWGGLGNDIFLGGTGNDLLISGGGNDVFSFTNGLAGGKDVIAGFTIGQDTLKLDGYGLTAPAITYAYGDSILNLQDGTQIVLFNVPNLTASSITLG